MGMGRLGGGGTEQKGKRTHGQQCGDYWGKGSEYKGTSGNGKKIQ